MSTHPKLFSLLLLLSLGLIWGSGYVIAKFATQNGVPPLGYSFWQSIGPALLLLLITLAKGELAFSKTQLRYYFVCGLIGITLPNTVMYYSASQLPAGLLSVIVNTVPILTYPLALLYQTEQFHPARLLAVMLGAFGIMMLLIPQSSFPDVTQWQIALFTLITPLCFSFCAIYINRHQPKTGSPLNHATGMLICSGLILGPMMLYQGDFYALSWPLNLADLAILLEIVLSSLGYVILFMLLKHAGPVYYSLVSGVVCITGLFWGYYLYDEVLTLHQMLCIGLILLAILSLSFVQPKEEDHYAQLDHEPVRSN